MPKRRQKMSKVSGTFEFLQVFGAAEKIKQSLRDAEKSQEKVEANGTGFSAELFCFARKTKNQMLTTSCWSLRSLKLSFLKSLRLYFASPIFSSFVLQKPTQL